MGPVLFGHARRATRLEGSPIMKRSALLALVAACSSTPSALTEVRSITTAGDTCGNWYENDNSITAQCAAGLECLIEVQIDVHGRDLAGICHPTNGATCDSQAPSCPSGWVCTAGDSGRGPTRTECMLRCTTNADCPWQFQVCSTGACRMLACPFTGDADANSTSYCPGAQCASGVCKPR
jgi:hypothetical protein